MKVGDRVRVVDLLRYGRPWAKGVAVRIRGQSGTIIGVTPMQILDESHKYARGRYTGYTVELDTGEQWNFRYDEIVIRVKPEKEKEHEEK